MSRGNRQALPAEGVKVCAVCGRIDSVDPAVMGGVAERLAADLGYTLDVGHVALSGTCRDCGRRTCATRPVRCSSVPCRTSAS